MIVFLIDLVRYALQILTVLIIVRAVLSWVPTLDYGHPVIRLIVRITDPVLVPVRHVVPPIGGMDLSPLVAIILLQLAGALLVGILQALVSGA